MKKNTLLVALFLWAACVFSQNSEPAPAKGQLFNNPVFDFSSYYQSTGKKSTTLQVNTWKNVGWKQQSSTNALFSTGAYQNNAEYKLESAVLKLPKLNGQHERLNLYISEQYELESYYDNGLVKVSTDNGRTWKVLSTRSGKSLRGNSLVNLTPYSGKKVKLAFELKADEANTYGGWDIFNVELKHEQLVGKQTINRTSKKSNTLSADLASVDAQKFPRFIFANVDLKYNGNPVGDADENSFVSVTETIDGVAYTVKKDETFKVYTPNNQTVSRPVDIVFLMDNSGSMGDEQNAVKNNVAAFVDGLQGFDYRLGLCRLGQSANSGKPILHNNAGWYTDPDEFKTMWQSVNSVDGGNEPSWDALAESATGYSFRNGAQKIFILITDEAITGNNLPISVIKDVQTVIDVLNVNGITMHAVVSAGTNFEQDFGAIATATNGQSFNITSSFNDILTTIGDQINNRYTIRYTPASYDFDGKERKVKVSINYSGVQTETTEGTYTPGKSPIVIRTDETLKLHTAGQEDYKAISIKVRSTDAIAPYTTGVTLYYKSAGSTDAYTEVVMTKITQGSESAEWEGVIPANDVKAPGITYYVKATDGQSTVTAPEFIDKAGYPWSFAVLPNIAPVVTNKTNITSLTVGDAVVIKADVVDNTNKVNAVYAYIRENDDISFTKYPMSNTSGDTYEYTFTLKKGITDYFVVGIDDFGVSGFDGSEQTPHSIVSNVPWEVVNQGTEKHRVNIGGLEFFPVFNIWNADIKMGTEELDVDDLIGVFYSTVENGQAVDKCAGYFLKGASSTGLFVSGDDPNTPEKDGFSTGESFKFKIFKADEKKVYDAEFTFRGATDTSFKDGGESNIATVYGYYTQTINLKKNQNLWSTYLQPIDNSFDAIFANAPTVTEIRNVAGQKWFPNSVSNALNNHAYGYGYEVYSNTASTVVVKGAKIDVTQVPISLIGNQQKTLVACLYESPENVESAFANHKTNVYVVDKYINDGNGLITIESYSPMYDMNRWADKNMNPGEAYYVFAITPDPAFTFPAATGAYVAKKNQFVVQNSIKQQVRSIDNYMHVFIPSTALTGISNGEIRAYNTAGELIGKTDASTTGTSLVLDGLDTDEGEAFELRLWSSENNSEKLLQVSEWEAGDGTYTNHKAAVVAEMETKALSDYNFEFQIYPSPAVDQFNLSFVADEQGQVQVSMTNMYGIATLKQTFESNIGQNKIVLPVQSLSKGVYFVTIIQNGQTNTQKVVIGK